MSKEFHKELQTKLEVLENKIRDLVAYLDGLKQENASLKQELEQIRGSAESSQDLREQVRTLQESKSKAARKIQTIIDRIDTLTINNRQNDSAGIRQE